ncbi:hypothetical protein GQX73_g7910 [Xylaria multiplex]|uniref:PD-(D/E)XK nuclease-like domain-containing protein n=1 Tax=Xylaria multiplex TaxID=323545 RepID=A0A7C8IK21_9PEZI|nr:hypothetical protein GQX73_g7910 [Xylaria multiplex]
MLPPHIVRDWIESVKNQPESSRKRPRSPSPTPASGPSDYEPPSLPRPPHSSRSRSTSPTKRLKPSKTSLRSRANLHRFEKPVIPHPLKGNAAHLPEDIKNLHKRIYAAAQFRHHIIPHEVRSLIEAVDDHIPDHVFRDPDHNSASALTTYKTLRSIVRASGISQKYRRLEAGWNHHVHTPLLDLVFGSLLDDGSDANDSNTTLATRKPVAARFEAVMGATIVGTTIPLLQQPQSDAPNLGLACSVSVDRSVQSSQDSTVDLAHVEPHAIHSRSESKKVDYVLVMYIDDQEPLHRVISDTTFEPQLGYGYINQTLLSNLLYNPIAVSIKTKIASSREDPLLQLGLWTAAWHKRMATLRERRFPATPQAYLAGSRVPPKLVSVPLIEVIAHEWFMYFACDSGRSIDVYGPLHIGSTQSMLEVYSLFTCLEYVKQWIETSFYTAMKDWFLEEQISAEIPTR